MRHVHGWMRQVLSVSATLGALVTSVSAVEAGGFAIREQSAHFQGSSFAGNAAGGALSSMFWNPAAAGQFNGFNTESAYSWIIPDSEITALPGSTLLGAPGLSSSSGEVGNQAIVPSTYLSYQLSPNLVFGFSLNAPFGLSTEPENRAWAGQTQARTSKIETYNAQPVLAYRVNPTLIVAAGLQIEYIEGTLKSAAGTGAAAPNGVIKGDDTALGFTAGILWQPMPGTSVGLGFRSSIDHNLEGTIGVVGIPVTFAGISAALETPETVTLSWRQELAPRWTGLATVEWANWSRLKSLDVVCQEGAIAGPCAGGAGTNGKSLPLGWHDGWFFALGAEYAWSPQLTLRAGAAYEISPIRDPDERPARLPDSDRVWASIGASYKWSERISLDFAYTHIFVDDARIDRTEDLAPGVPIRLLADADASVDILSVGLKMKLGGDPTPAPLK
ncbi:MAG: outer membrane protein transport protein [Hyphomicrobiaceae bacterium]